MVLKIHMNCDTTEPICFEVIFLGETKIIDNEHHDISFFVDKEGTYEIGFVQKETDESFLPSQKAMYLLLLPVIGLFCLLSTFGDDDYSIFKKINPYLISNIITLTIEKTSQLDFTYARSEYNKKTKKWGAPNIVFSLPVQADRIELSKNDKAFENCYLNFKRSFSAICFDVVVLFLSLAFYALHLSEKSAFIILLILSLSISIICLLALMWIKKIIKKSKQKCDTHTKFRQN